MPAARQTVGGILNKLIERVNSNIRRLRILEQESSVGKTRVTAMEEELLRQKNEITATVKDLHQKVEKMDEHITTMESTMTKIVGQLKKATTLSKIKELEQLIEIYNTIKSQFMTRDEVEQLLDERSR